MSNTQQNFNNPARTPNVPNVPNPQTNEGTLEHTGIPFEPIKMITDIPPDFGWMAQQYKYLTSFDISANDNIGKILFSQKVVMSNADWNITSRHVLQWYDVPFAASKWWNGKVAFRFTIVKPPRVPGKLLLKFRQDCMNDRGIDIPKQPPPDTKMRSVIKEWDLAQSNQFEFDITASTPLEARPTHIPKKTPEITDKPLAIADYVTPWYTYEMGRIWIEVAQTVMPGGIFPDTYTIIVEKALKDATFYTPTDPRTNNFLALYQNDDEE